MQSDTYWDDTISTSGDSFLPTLKTTETASNYTMSITANTNKREHNKTEYPTPETDSNRTNDNEQEDFQMNWGLAACCLILFL